MYNTQLDTFALVAELGSFSAAGTHLYITPSAVNQQMTALEERLGARLFVRSRQRLQLTEAGAYLLEVLPTFRNHAMGIQDHLKELDARPENTVLRIGLPHMHTLRHFYNLWSAYSLENTTCQIQLVANNSWIEKETYNSYIACDLVEYPNIRAAWMKGRRFLKLEDMPSALAIPLGHPLLQIEHLRPEDLEGYGLLVPRGDLINALLPDLQALEKIGVQLHYQNYSPELLDNCLLNGWATPVLGKNPKIPPSLRAVPMDWVKPIPYGFSIKTPCSRAMESFLAYVVKTTGAEYIE